MIHVWFKGYQVGQIFSTGGDFPWIVGEMIPTVHTPDIRYFEWYEWLELIDRYFPFSEEVYEVIEDKSSYPRDDHQRFLLSETYKTIKELRVFRKLLVQFEAENQNNRLANEVNFGIRIEESEVAEFVDSPWWQAWLNGKLTLSEFDFFVEEFLYYKNWKVTPNADMDAEELNWFPYPPDISEHEGKLTTAWR